MSVGDGTLTAVATVLDREMYTEAEAARVLGIPQQTLHYWLEGKPPQYRPVIRQEPRRDRTVTWAEFVEAVLLREYRRTHEVPMAQLRRFIDLLREQFGVPYPLADRRPYVSGRDLVYDAQTTAALAPEFCLVAVANEQFLLTPPSQAFLNRVEWDGDVVAAWRPDPNPDSLVSVSPTVRFGRPAVSGVSTEAIWEQEQSGVDVGSIAEIYQVTEAEVLRAGIRELTPGRLSLCRMRPAEIRFYIDPDLLGLAHVLGQLRADITYPGDPGGIKFKRERPACPVKAPRTPDDEWIPLVTAAGWLIITRDRHIQVHRREIAAVRDHGARMVTLAGEDARSTFDQLEVLMCQWRGILKLCDAPGPFIYSATRTGKLRLIPLD
jgi:uncharacterized protein (DUF433 family)